MAERFYLNDNWKFASEFTKDLLKPGYDDTSMEEVRIPHTVKETPFNYFDEHLYQMISGYKKEIIIPKEWEGKAIRLTFEGVAHKANVYVNGQEVMENSCGYTAFTADISKVVNFGTKNSIVVKVDSNESLNQPPFGFVIDYMTYGGIYRDVYVEVSENTYIDDVFVTSKTDGKNAKINLDIKVAGSTDNVRAEVYFDNNNVLSADVKDEHMHLDFEAQAVNLWDIDNPNLYEVMVKLVNVKGEVLDTKSIRHGIRNSEFRPDGYYLNGRKVKIRGLNRHQSYAYVGYAMPDSMQVMDVDIIKNELGLNAVRTSHYPQAHSFYDRCDELGVLVFTEIPGWQHIGDAVWKDQAVLNVAKMIEQYRNHSSIILWGVRINESPDDDEFYTRTNAVAHKLDPSRPTGGVRCIKKSNLLEDVYTYNDFVHDGTTAGCEPKKNVTSDMNKPYLISEYNGHMFSTKAFDSEEHRREHAIRHANVLDAVASEDNIAGSFGWCMFDYNTHKDFGSGDRICYHGVMDMFRNPKMAANVYKAEGCKDTVLELSSTMDIGEHPGCNRGATWIFSNADSVKTYKNGRFLKEYFPGDSKYKNLKHGPIQINDFIGNAILEGENFSPKQAETVKEILNLTALTSISHLPKRVLWLAAKAVLIYHMSPQSAVGLFNKYIGDWGGTSTEYKFEAIKDGKVVKTLTKMPTKGVHLFTEVDHTNLVEGKTYDVAAIRIRAVDDFDNQISFFNEPIEVSAEGPIEIIGDKVLGLKGGMAGVYVKTIGMEGNATLTIKNAQCETVKINFNVNSKFINKM